MYNMTKWRKFKTSSNRAFFFFFGRNLCTVVCSYCCQSLWCGHINQQPTGLLIYITCSNSLAVPYPKGFYFCLYSPLMCFFLALTHDSGSVSQIQLESVFSYRVWIQWKFIQFVQRLIPETCWHVLQTWTSFGMISLVKVCSMGVGANDFTDRIDFDSRFRHTWLLLLASKCTT